jgi:two-component sensor histidine kinase
MKRFLILLQLFTPLIVPAQITSIKGFHEYKHIFVETDDFDSDYLDLMEASLKDIFIDTLRFRVYNDLGYHYHTRNLHRAFEIIEEGLEEVRKSGDKLWEGRLQVSQGAILLRLEELDMAEMVLRSAQGKIPESETWLLLTNLGYVFERRGDLGEAFEFALRTLELGEKYEDKKAMAMAYSDLSNLFWKQGKFEKGEEYGRKSIEIFKKRGLKDLDYDFTLHVLGNNLMELQKYDEALFCFQQSTLIGEKYGFYNNLSDAYISKTDLYTRISDFKNAEKVGKEALKYAELLENDFMVMRSLLCLGKLKNEEKKFDEAIVYLQRGLRIVGDDFGDSYYLSLTYLELSKALEGRNRINDSYRAYKKYHELTQKVFNAEADQRIASLQTQMELGQKESTISLQNEKIKRQKTLQVFMITLAGLMVFFLIFLYRVFLRRRKYSLLLENQNNEKAFLLKEIHHRVKNNLETISSLLSLQTAQIENDELQCIMLESQNRVHSMGMIHQNLYQGENLAAIEMKQYFINLGRFIIDAYDASEKIVLECKMGPLELDVDRAIPIGLIVNELITNSLKYAFPNKMEGKISISLNESDAHLILKVSDNGIGMGESPKIQGSGFGSQLISLLTKQLDGKMTLITHIGTEVFFEFQTGKAA